MLRAQRYARALSMIMMDLDHFKNVNDTMGHLAGDLVLTHVAAVCKGLLRASDIFGRYGGEEFAVFLPETSPSGRSLSPVACVIPLPRNRPRPAEKKSPSPRVSVSPASITPGPATVSNP